MATDRSAGAREAHVSDLASKLSPLGLLALGIVAEQPRHPYDVYRTMTVRREDRLAKLRPGTLNHQIARLAEDGLIEAIGTEREGNRPDRTTYRVTETGRSVLREAIEHKLGTLAYEYPEFPVALAKASHLDRDKVIAVLTGRHRALQLELTMEKDVVDRLRRQRLPRRYWVDVDYQYAMLAAEVDYLDRLLADLRSGDLDWSEPKPADFQPIDEDSFRFPSPLHPDLPPRKG